MFSAIRSTVRALGGLSRRAQVFVVGSFVMAAALVTPALAAATETEAEKKAGEKITEAVGKVSTSGESYILLVLAGLVGLIALVIILPKAIAFIKRFI